MKKLIIILFVIFQQISSAQKKIDSVYKSYFKHQRELPFLHLNKTSFIKGEEIWFKAYVYNQKKQNLSNFTTNLYCYIYDDEGNIKNKKIFYVKNGLTNGSFKIDSSYTKPNYYIGASTNWMRNFKEDETFFQRINILDNVKSVEEKNLENNLEIKIFPEGGHIISSIENSFGILIKDKYNKGIKIKKGEVLDNKNNLITSFSSNEFGLGKFNFIYNSNQQYKVVIQIDNKTLEKKIPKAENYGINLSVKNLISDYVEINIITNQKTLPNIINKNYSLLIHNTNKSFKQDITFSEKNNFISILLSKNKFSKGVNIITLFDEKEKPISERLVYIHPKKIKENITIKSTQIINDSIKIRISKENLEEKNYYLSASLLPFNTKAYTPENNIISKLILKPFIKGYIENPLYYFTNINNKKKSELDLLLLTQGWSKYDWKNIFNSSNFINYKNENGMSLSGILNMKKTDSTTKVLAFSKNNIFELTEKNLYLKNNSTIKFLAFTKNQAKETKGYFTQTPLTNKLNTPKLNYKTGNEKLQPLYFTKATDNDSKTLDGLTLKLKRQNPIIFQDIDYIYVITKPIKNDNNLNAFFIEKGYSFRSNYSINSTRSMQLNGIKIKPLILEINNSDLYYKLERLRKLHNYPYSIALPLDLQDNFVTLPLAFQKAIFPYIKKSTLRKQQIKKTNKIIIKNGFSESKEYYQPKYSTLPTETFESYGTLHWEPKINLGKNNIYTSLKVPVLNQKKMVLFIEGLTSDGSFILEKKIINIEAE
jgi:hypothetical protein